ncbi:anterior fat body protein [Nesidiocoris tenuis]|uniref:Anterior fat body protein n=1 Tax=Nesidiocoris tenuis TaxID=355587 RepID=A0ABN7A667_9HEMI|nr:anterior fat body protein [Nesidiocoris tenuis]
MAPKIEVLTGIPTCELGEAPIWDVKTESLYFTDLPATAGHLIKYTPKTGSSIKCTLGKHVSFIIPIKGRQDEFVLGSNLEILHVKWDTESNKILEQKVLAKLTDELPGGSVNDAKCDPKGRLWFGTYGEKFAKGAGNIYSFTNSTGLVKHVPKINLSNGLDWSPDGKKFYHIDTADKTVSQYDFDLKSGSIKFEKVLIDFTKENIPGLPDGMTVDTDGNIWVASVCGGRVIQFDHSSGKILQNIELEEASQATSVAFGGPQMDELYVVSGNFPTIPSTEFVTFPQLPPGSNGGRTFRITGTGSKGIPDDLFDFDL